MTTFGGACALEGGLYHNSATFMADNLLVLFTNRVADLQNACRATIESFHTVRQSIFEPKISIPTLEAKEIELLDLVARLETQGKEVETLLSQVKIDSVAKIIGTLPMYRDMTEIERRELVLEYCEDVRLKFSWMRPQALAVKRSMVAGTVMQVKTKTRIAIR